jgi:hypothetical protein
VKPVDPLCSLTLRQIKGFLQVGPNSRKAMVEMTKRVTSGSQFVGKNEDAR